MGNIFIVYFFTKNAITFLYAVKFFGFLFNLLFGYRNGSVDNFSNPP